MYRFICVTTTQEKGILSRNNSKNLNNKMYILVLLVCTVSALGSDEDNVHSPHKKQTHKTPPFRMRPKRVFYASSAESDDTSASQESESSPRTSLETRISNEWTFSDCVEDAALDPDVNKKYSDYYKSLDLKQLSIVVLFSFCVILSCSYKIHCHKKQTKHGRYVS